MGWFSRKSPPETGMTGVSASLTAEHRRPGGEFHEHTWEITAWFAASYYGDALYYRDVLDKIVARLQGTKLPDHFHRGEELAHHIGAELSSAHDGRACLRVDVSRSVERIHAQWNA